MNNDPETADGARLVTLAGLPIRGTFPRSWGKPPDDLDERERWMRRNIREGEERLNRGQQAEGQKPRTGRQMLAYLNQRRVCPALANAVRMRLIELLERGPV